MAPRQRAQTKVARRGTSGPEKLLFHALEAREDLGCALQALS
jgi:hypothetical protein